MHAVAVYSQCSARLSFCSLYCRRLRSFPIIANAVLSGDRIPLPREPHRLLLRLHSAKKKSKVNPAFPDPMPTSRPPRREKRVFPPTDVNVEFMHSFYELNMYHQRKIDKFTVLEEDIPGVFRKTWNDDEIFALADDYYGKDCRNQKFPLQYYNCRTRQWKPFIGTADPEVTALYCGQGNRSMPLRLLPEFDDADDEVAEAIAQRARAEPPEHLHSEAVRGVLDAQVQYLKAHNYVRVSPTELAQQTSDEKQPLGDAIPTKQWLLQRAETDPFLANLLLTVPGALKHLTQCLHWDRVWNMPTIHQD